MNEPPKAPRKHRRAKKRKKGRDAGSKMFMRRVKDARAFASSIEVHAETVATAIHERLTPVLRAEGEAVPDHGMTLELVARSVQAALEALRHDHHGYVEQTARCNRLSSDCDRIARQEVYPQAVCLRRLLEAHFGKRESRVLHAFRGRIPNWRDGLREQVGHTLDLLRGAGSTLPEPTVAGARADLAGWIRLIEGPYEALIEELDELTAQNCQREALGDRRRAAMKTFDETLHESRAVAEALFSLAGCPKRFGKNMRAYYERRWLSRWARQRREARRQGAGHSGVAAGGDRRRGGMVANLSTWLTSRFKSA